MFYRFRDTSRWRLAHIENICSDDLRANISSENSYWGTDHFSKNDAALKAYLKFNEFGGLPSDKTSIALLIQFDAITLDAADAYAESLGLNFKGDNFLEQHRYSHLAENDLHWSISDRGEKIP